MYVVTVDFTLKPRVLSSFLSLMITNAKKSREEEPGCHYFDVCHDQKSTDHVFLYEVYEDRAAFDAHLASAHFKEFDVAVRDMILNKQVHDYVRLSG